MPNLPVQQVQMNIYQSNACREDLHWLHSDDEPRVQEKQQVMDQQPYIPISAAYLTYPIST